MDFVFEIVGELAGGLLEFIIGLFVKGRRKDRAAKASIAWEIFRSLRAFVLTLAVIILIFIIIAVLI